MELARRSGVSKSFLSEVETGQRNISTDYLTKLARTLGATLEYLVHGLVLSNPERPIEIPQELSLAAEQENWPHSTVIKLLRAHESLVARRSSRSIRPSVEEWKSFAKDLRKYLK